MDNKELIQIFKDKEVGSLLKDEAMKNHTTFKIGGPVDLMILPKTEDQVKLAIDICKSENLNYMVMGNGSNLLVKDGGIRGVIIKLNDNFNKIEVRDNKIYAEAGALLCEISREALKNSLSGFEFASGIPGALGGAMTMNAGAYGGEMKDVTEKLRVLDSYGNIREYTNEEMNFRYRGSRVEDEGLVVLSAVIKLENKEKEDIKAIIDDLTYKRTSKQPLEYPSGGSTFKRPEGYYAGKLIDDSGLRGLRYGGAEVSKKHCGFVINKDRATCKDVLTLIETIKKTVKDNYEVDLEREIKLLGEEL